MKNFIQNLFSRSSQNSHFIMVPDRKEIEKRVAEGTRFVIKQYGGALKSLAEYDKTSADSR